MNVSVRGGALALAVATASLLVVPLAGPASAAQSGSCKTVTTALKAGKITATFTKCTPASLSAGGSATFTNPPTGTTKGTLKLTLTWTGGKGTTTTTIKYAPAATKGKCAAGTSRVTVTGSVTGGTGAAATIIKKGEPLTISICAVTSGTKIGNASLEPGTKFKL